MLPGPLLKLRAVVVVVFWEMLLGVEAVRSWVIVSLILWLKLYIDCFFSSRSSGF